jgi:phage repressor protein C with HTH and peptisase S24 domain
MRPGDKQLCLADEFVYIKKARARLSGGDGCWAQEDFYDEFYSFRLDWIKTVVLAPEKAILMDVTGNSMAPKIKDGDTAMIDTGRTEIIDGRVYAFADTRTTDQFELRIKALYNVGDENILIESYNVPESLRTQTRPRGDIKVVGEVVWIGRALVPRQGL